MSQSKAGFWFLLAQWFLLAGFALSIVFRELGSRSVWLVVAGILLAVFGIVVVFAAGAAHYAVNKSGKVRISPTPDASRKLVDIGIYGKVRHPMYLGTIIVLAGLTLSFGGYYSAVLTLLGLIFVNVKASYEEKLLREVYPEYQGYTARTGRIFPRF